jgi:hypothetical protein
MLLPPWLITAVDHWGFPVVIAGYYLYKDWKLSGQLVEALAVIKAYLANETTKKA